MTTQPPLEITCSRQFESWLGEHKLSLAVSTYQGGAVLMFGPPQAESGKMWLHMRALERPMGMAVSGDRLTVAALNQVVDFRNPKSGDEAIREPLYVPQMAWFTGDLDIHDIAYDKAGRPVMVNTLFSCLCTVSETHSFKPVWWPSFISRLAAEDRCHLNGLAMEDGAPAYVTAVSETDIADGWRDNRRTGGVVIDVRTGETIARGLSMPHSPRVHGGKLYVLNAGTGEFGTIDRADGTFTPIAFCPGYARGLSFHGDFAIIGLSEFRDNKTFSDLAVGERLARDNIAARCGLQIIDLRTGDAVHWLRLSGVIKELFEVVAMPGAIKPQMIGFKSDEIRRVISVEDI